MNFKKVLLTSITTAFFSVAPLPKVEIPLIMVSIEGLKLASIVTIRTIEKKKNEEESSFKPEVTVLVPTHNEEVGIEHTINSILKSIDVVPPKIIIIDDGSTDKTLEVINQKFGNNPRIQLISKENSGKSKSLNLGLENVQTDLYISIDGDTIFLPNTIANLVKHFEDPSVNGVAGNVQIGNEFFLSEHKTGFNWLTTSQRLEYITGKNFDKTVMSYFGAYDCIPGAIGCYRTKDVRMIGGYNSDCMGEDTLLTYELLKMGKVKYEPNAVCYTEAPENSTELIKQRFRWTFGMFEVLKLNMNLIINPINHPVSYYIAPSLLLSVIGSCSMLANLVFVVLGFLVNKSNLVNFILGVSVNPISGLLFLLFIINHILPICDSKSNHSRVLLLFIPIKIVVISAICTISFAKALTAFSTGQKPKWGILKRTGNIRFLN
jgi:peptidoglycan-N-acetylglucosamine deacetylase